jgi:hypothetical protein
LVFLFGAEKVNRYLDGTAKKFRAGKFGVDDIENPVAPLYSFRGNYEASKSELAGPGVVSDKVAIEDFLHAPFHGMAMTTPRSAVQAFSRSSTGRVGLDVMQDYDWNLPSVTTPFLFPLKGHCLKRRMVHELPDKTESCSADYQSNPWTGLPIWAMLPSGWITAGAVANVSLADGTVYSSAKGQLCVQTKESFKSSDAMYGAKALAQLSSNNGIIVIPRVPLTGGQQVAVTISLPRDSKNSQIKWQFYVQAGENDCVVSP